MARAYGTMANGGIRPQLRMFEDLVAEGGGTVERREISFERAVDAGTAFLITSMLESVVDGGTGRRIRREGMTGPIAGKTGTTNDSKDAWFSGYTPELVAVVWVGFDQPRSHGLTGGGAALPIWIKFMQEAVGKEVRGRFLPPSSVVAAECGGGRTEFFLVGTEPSFGCVPRGAPTDVAEGRRDENRVRGGRDPSDLLPEGPKRFFDWLRGR